MSIATFGSLLGGIGLFLLGMTMMTESLTAAAGRGLRRVLSSVTRTRARAFVVGAATTAVVQSSSATTLAVIGFVSAGLIGFADALALILGANVGTTATSWIVAGIGVKISSSVFALPLVGVGAFLRLVFRGRLASAGLALAGFGLIFVGIDALQSGLSGLDSLTTLRTFGQGLWGRLALVGLGLVMTVVMQSSSVALATTVTAVHVGTFSLDQGAALAIGQNIGTTVTAMIAALGATTAARRTAVAHILFNVVTGVAAFALLGPLVAMVQVAGDAFLGGSPALELALFHTAFNVGGGLIFLPFTRPWARLARRLVPDRGPRLTAGLSRTALRVPAFAIEAGRRACFLVLSELLRVTQQTVVSVSEVSLAAAGTPTAAELLQRQADARRADHSLGAVDTALAAISNYLGQVRTSPQFPAEHAEHVATLRAVDHLIRLANGLREADVHRETFLEVLVLLEDAETLLAGVVELIGRIDRAASVQQAVIVPELLHQFQELSMTLRARRKARRPQLLSLSAATELGPETAEDALAAIRWLDRLAYHAWRAAMYLAPDVESSEPITEAPVAVLDELEDGLENGS